MSVTPDIQTLVPPPEERPPKVRTRSTRSMFDAAVVRRAAVDSLIKLNPKTQARNPVMFVVLVGSVWTTILFFRDLANATTADNLFVGLVAISLWFTVLFANFAEAVAEGRGKARADTLRKTRSETVAFVQQADGSVLETPSASLQVATGVWSRPASSSRATATWSRTLLPSTSRPSPVNRRR